ncbi:MAG: phage integrase N-terminal SAM-like domain-containing protein [Anaerolineae bacterium]
MREAIQPKHYSSSSEESYAHWIKRLVLFHGKHQPNEIGAPEIIAVLTHLVVEQRLLPRRSIRPSARSSSSTEGRCGSTWA